MSKMVRVARSARTGPEVHAVSELDALTAAGQMYRADPSRTAESRGLIGERQFALMHQGALLVNAARGPIVDTDALVEALNSGKIRAALDVTDPEPLPEGIRCGAAQICSSRRMSADRDRSLRRDALRTAAENCAAT